MSKDKESSIIIAFSPELNDIVCAVRAGSELRRKGDFYGSVQRGTAKQLTINPPEKSASTHAHAHTYEINVSGQQRESIAVSESRDKFVVSQIK